MAQVSPRYPRSAKGTESDLRAEPRQFDFTNTAVEAIEPPAAGRVEYRDSRNPSLMLRVAASGTKSFCVVRKVAGKFVRVTLGTFKRSGDQIPRMTVDRARLALRKIDGALAEGVNVNRQKREARAKGRTLSDWLDAYLQANSKLKDSTRADYRRALHEVCADWMTRPLAEITRDQIKARHKRHGAERSEARANNAVRVLRALYNFAGITPNPASNPKKKGQGGSFMYDDKRKRTLIKPKQMPAWWAAASGLSGKRSDSGAVLASDLLCFLVLTGLRAGEACGLRWSDVDLDEGVITVADTKNREPHVLPLSTGLQTIVKRRHGERTGPFVFGAKASPELPYSYNTLRGWFEVVAAESGVRVTAHDLRRTFATIAESLDISTSTVKRLLNHRTGRSDVTEGYIVPSAERLRGAMQRIEDQIMELATAPTDSAVPAE